MENATGATPLLTPLFLIYLLVGSTSKVTAEQKLLQCRQVVLLGVKWVLRYRPGAECKDPGCPAALLHQPTISQEQPALHENNYDLFKFEEFFVKVQSDMEDKTKNARKSIR